MGQEILYCAGCGAQLRGPDFEKGRAFKDLRDAWCSKCAPADLRRTSERAAKSASEVRRKTSSGIHEARGETPRAGTRRAAGTVRSMSRRSSSSGPVVAGSVAAVVVVLLIVVAAASSGSNGNGGAVARRTEPRREAPRVKEPAPTPAAKAPAPEPPPVRRIDPAPVRSARSRFEEALEWAEGFKEKENLTARISLYERALELAAGTGREAEVEAKIAELRSQRDARLKEWARGLEGRLGPLVRDGKFPEAFRLLEEEGRQARGPEWTAHVSEREAETRKTMEGRLAALVDAAKTARAAGREEQVAKIRKTVGSWEAPELADRLKKALASVPKPPKGTPEERAYAAAWKRAMERAAAWDFEKAAAMLKEAAVALPEGKAREAAAADMELLASAESLYTAGRARLLRIPEGRTVALRHPGPGGALVTTTGKVREVREGRVILETGATIDVGAVTSATLLALLPSERVGDRAAAFLSLLEGGSVEEEALPGRFGELKIPSWTAPIAGIETQRRLLSDPLKAAGAVTELARRLEADADTAYVRRNRETLEADCRRGREFLLQPSALTPGGGFLRSRSDDVPSFWTVGERADDPSGNTLDFAWSQVEGVKYRCWVYAGGCCAETLDFRFQATGLESRDGMAEPGGSAAVPVKQRVMTSVRTHADHGGPRRPSRWGWVQLPLPETPGGSVVKVRLLSGAKGFSVAYVFVTADRRAPPREKEVAKLVEVRKVAAPEPVVTAGLAGHWPLADGSGTSASEATGRASAGRLKGDPKWISAAAGRPGLVLDGDDWIDLGRDLDLARNVPGVTLAGWFRADRPVKTGKQVTLVGLSMHASQRTNNSRATLELHPGPKIRLGGRCGDGNAKMFYGDFEIAEFRPGRWVHVAGVLDFAASRLTFYVDGARRGGKTNVGWTKGRTPDTPSSYGAIGAEDDGDGKFFAGAVSDLRIYGRALDASEVALLASAQAASSATSRGSAPRPGVVALYRFDEGNGNVVRDVSGVGSALDLEIRDPGAVSWLPGGGLRVNREAQIVHPGEPVKLRKAVQESREITVEAWIRPASADQQGPARIVTCSKGSGSRAFTLGQGVSTKNNPPRNSFTVRLHTSGADANGYPQFFTPVGSTTTRLTHVVFTRAADGQERFYLDGVETGRNDRKGNFDPWKPEYRLALANEIEASRPWLGDLRLVALYARALSPQEVSALFTAGP